MIGRGSEMEIKKLEQAFSVCQLSDLSEVELGKAFYFLEKTEEEISLVCPTADVPEHAARREDGWLAFRIEGVLDFSLIGILAAISALLAEQKIGIFAVSTYNTDYILTKAEDYGRALEALEEAGYRIMQ